MSNLSFTVYPRSIESNQKQLRKSGYIPGIIYGEFLDNPISIQMSNSQLKNLLRKNNSGSIIEVNLDNNKYNCVVKEIQRNSMLEILHVDFQYAKTNEVIKMRIPIAFIGQESLESKRLLLETYNSYIDLRGSVQDIPEYIEVNVSNMNYNDKIYIEDIRIPEGVTVLSDTKNLLATVSN